MKPQPVAEYHVFLASPGDTDKERKELREFFDDYNRHTARHWSVRFVVVDWENYATAGVGRPQELITEQTLGEFRESLALVIGLMGQRFGSPTGTYESGTEEEFEWAFKSNQETGFPEIKWFFREVDQFVAPSDTGKIEDVLEQWKKVQSFRQKVARPDFQLFYKTFTDVDNFRDVASNDLSLWLADPKRPWVSPPEQADPGGPTVAGAPGEPAPQPQVRYWAGRPASLGEGFVGREENLLAIAAAFAGHRTVVVSGGAGSGKSRLAAGHAHRRRSAGSGPLVGPR